MGVSDNPKRRYGMVFSSLECCRIPTEGVSLMKFEPIQRCNGAAGFAGSPGVWPKHSKPGATGNGVPAGVAAG